MPYLEATPSGIRLRVHVQPRASRTELAGLHGDSLKIRLAAPPIDGAANEALIRFVAETLQLPRSAVSLLSGMTSRRKTLAVAGLTIEAARARLNLCSTD